MKHYIKRHVRKDKITGYLKNPYVIGAGFGLVYNMLKGEKIIDIEKIKSNISKKDATNPLLPLLAGILLKNKELQAIGTFLIVDPINPTNKTNEKNKEIINNDWLNQSYKENLNNTSQQPNKDNKISIKIK